MVEDKGELATSESRVVAHARNAETDQPTVQAHDRQHHHALQPRSSHKHTYRTAGRKGTLPDDEGEIVCIETARGHKRIYRRLHRQGEGWDGFDVTDDRVSSLKHVQQLFQSYLLPQGYPDSVAPEYARYMAWRGCQYFFGGAISVFTTRSLLGALGVAGKHSGETAAAINWVVKDGAGRLGRFLFARWGRDLDCELKQFRLIGDVLMEASAALELSTISMPQAFLPLACTANLAKNLAAVAASSTRAPIYRTFALQNNLADVTAKGESVANLADIGGTVAGILLSRSKLGMLPTFCLLSAGYLVASRQEVAAIQLPYLNRARLAFSARTFLQTGVVPDPALANDKEPLLPWGPYGQGRVVLGARVEDACQGPAEYADALHLFSDCPFALTYRPETKQAYVMLKNGASGLDALCGAFHAHVLLHMVDAVDQGLQKGNLLASEIVPRSQPISADADSSIITWKSLQDLDNGVLLNMTASRGLQLYGEFLEQAERTGWQLQNTMLNPKEARLIVPQHA